MRIVIKVGSHVLTEEGAIAKNRMMALVELISELKAVGKEVTGLFWCCLCRAYPIKP